MTMSRLNRSPDQTQDLRAQMIDQFKEEKGQYPSRTEVHKKNKNKKKKRMKYPVISVLAIFFILTPVLIYSIWYYYDSRGVSRVNGVDNSDYENVFIKKR
ncbi:hypothetical protein [Metabacillus fastidiosus]|uniref:hypothetical protein n=1 Tax=Metabacillus fastidiosus TaxID=1458 RepID=UPI003D2BD97F